MAVLPIRGVQRRQIHDCRLDEDHDARNEPKFGFVRGAALRHGCAFGARFPCCGHAWGCVRRRGIRCAGGRPWGGPTPAGRTRAGAAVLRSVGWTVGRRDLRAVLVRVAGWAGLLSGIFLARGLRGIDAGLTGEGRPGCGRGRGAGRGSDAGPSEGGGLGLSHRLVRGASSTSDARVDRGRRLRHRLNRGTGRRGGRQPSGKLRRTGGRSSSPPCGGSGVALGGTGRKRAAWLSGRGGLAFKGMDMKNGGRPGTGTGRAVRGTGTKGGGRSGTATGRAVRGTGAKGGGRPGIRLTSGSGRAPEGTGTQSAVRFRGGSRAAFRSTGTRRGVGLHIGYVVGGLTRDACRPVGAPRERQKLPVADLVGCCRAWPGRQRQGRGDGGNGRH